MQGAGADGISRAAAAARSRGCQPTDVVAMRNEAAQRRNTVAAIVMSPLRGSVLRKPLSVGSRPRLRYAAASRLETI